MSRSSLWLCVFVCEFQPLNVTCEKRGSSSLPLPSVWVFFFSLNFISVVKTLYLATSSPHQQMNYKFYWKSILSLNTVLSRWFPPDVVYLPRSQVGFSCTSLPPPFLSAAPPTPWLHLKRHEHSPSDSLCHQDQQPPGKIHPC